jgi:hypothetical protein
VLAGDYNVVPTDRDIYPTRSWSKDALLQPESRAAFRRLLDQGWVDAIRTLHPDEPMHTFRDYMRDRWRRDAGLRIDHLQLNRDAAERLVEAGVDREVRGEDGASDHAPAWIVLRRLAGPTHREVHIFAREIDVVQAGGNSEVDVAVCRGISIEAVHQPLRREIRGRADGQDRRALPLHQPFRPDGDPVESIPHHGEIVAAGLGNDEALTFAIEELQSQQRLERLHLMAHGALRDAQRLAGPCEAPVACRCLKGFQRVEGWKAAEHHAKFMRKTRARSRKDALRKRRSRLYSSCSQPGTPAGA